MINTVVSTFDQLLVRAEEWKGSSNKYCIGTHLSPHFQGRTVPTRELLATRSDADVLSICQVLQHVLGESAQSCHRAPVKRPGRRKPASCPGLAGNVGFTAVKTQQVLLDQVLIISPSQLWGSWGTCG